MGVWAGTDTREVGRSGWGLVQGVGEVGRGLVGEGVWECGRGLIQGRGGRSGWGLAQGRGWVG